MSLPLPCEEFEHKIYRHRILTGASNTALGVATVALIGVGVGGGIASYDFTLHVLYHRSINADLEGSKSGGPTKKSPLP